MLVIHRFTPFFVGMVVAGALAVSSVFPLAAIWVLPLMFMVVALLMVRLMEYKWKHRDRVVVVSVVMMFLLSSVLLFLFLDDVNSRIILGIVVALLVYFYSEHIFTFVHLPGNYQPYSLQNLTGVLSVLSLFFFVGGSHALMLLVQVPLVVLVVAFFPMVFFTTISALWIANVPREQSQLYALGGAIIFTELFASVSYLPSTFLTNGAILAVLFYLFLGISRAHSTARLTRSLVGRYLGVGFSMLLAVLVTAQWV